MRVVTEPVAGMSGKTTFAWAKEPALDADVSSLDQNAQFHPVFQQVIERELRSRGYRKARPGEAANLEIGYFIVLEESGFRQIKDRYFGYPVPKGYSVGGLSAGPTPSQLEVGALVFEARDARSRTPLWKGAVLTDIQRSRSAEERAGRISGAVSRLLADFPKAG